MMAAVPPAARRICNVCCQQVAQYTCPRCHKPYCSSACYQRHGQQCTESFYREQATSQMKSTVADKRQQQHMLQILQRLHDQGHMSDLLGDADSSSDSSDDGAGESDLEAALNSMPALQQLIKQAIQQGDTFDVESADITSELLAELEQLSLEGHLSHLVAPWQPWWNTQAAAELHLNAAGQRVIAEVVQQEQQQTNTGKPAQQRSLSSLSDEASSQGTAALPAPPADPLPSLHTLAGPRFKPSPLLLWQLLQLLAAYCTVMRLYNGEPDCAGGWEAAELLLQLAPPLSQLLLQPASTADNTMQQQQAAEAQAAAVVPPESLRSAYMQLTAAAADVGDLAGGPAGQRGVLQLALSDTARLLDLGRSVVLLALTDGRRIVDNSAQSIKLHIQSHQPRLQQPVHASSKEGPTPSDKQTKQHLRQLKLHLKLAAHKLMFFSVWCNEQEPALYASLAEELFAELQEQQQINAANAAAQEAASSALAVGPSQATKQAAVRSAQPAIVPLGSVVPARKQQHGNLRHDHVPATSDKQQTAAEVDLGVCTAVEPTGGGISLHEGDGLEQQVSVGAGKLCPGKDTGRLNAAGVVAVSGLYDLD